jgi:predicted RecA/RadA family phage recombinase
MVMLFEKRPLSDHIRVAAFPVAKKKGEIVVLGNLLGFSDYDTEAGAPGSINIGKMASVFQADKADLPSVAIGNDVYVTTDEELASSTAAGSKYLGTVVAVGSDSFDIAVVG